MKARLDYVFKSEDEYQIMEEFLGFELKGEKYQPIFPYFAHVSIKIIRSVGSAIVFINNSTNISEV